MKASKETALFRVLTGSRLYGTATEKSDFDYKVVCLPSLDTLLLNTKVTNRKEKPEGSGAGDKMQAGETETEYLPLQVFFDDFFAGQTYALELAFAVVDGWHETSYEGGEWSNNKHLMQHRKMWVMMNELVDNFTVRDVKKMVGYAVSQSRLYGVKTDRFASLKCVTDLVRETANKVGMDSTLRDNPELLAAMLKFPHVKSVDLEQSHRNSVLAPAVEVVGKQFHLTNKLSTVYECLKNTLNQYGDRVAQFSGEGVDWKALSHALRIMEQAVELSKTGFLKFPRPNAAFLLAVKEGKVDLQEATELLHTEFAKLDNSVANSVLKERTPELTAEFRDWKLTQFKRLYQL